MISYFVYNETLTPLYLETLNGISHAGSDPCQQTMVLTSTELLFQTCISADTKTVLRNSSLCLPQGTCGKCHSLHCTTSHRNFHTPIVSANTCATPEQLVCPKPTDPVLSHNSRSFSSHTGC